MEILSGVARLSAVNFAAICSTLCALQREVNFESFATSHLEAFTCFFSVFACCCWFLWLLAL